MNLVIATIFITIFWLIGIHHYIKHSELKGINRFMQYHDIINAYWNIVKSHEGIQIICLLTVIYALFI